MLKYELDSGCLELVRHYPKRQAPFIACALSDWSLMAVLSAVTDFDLLGP
ncbi:hypothetical protein ACFLV7_11215 [Chloroflexota bacterium]